jgi:hypothetical protein
MQMHTFTILSVHENDWLLSHPTSFTAEEKDPSTAVLDASVKRKISFYFGWESNPDSSAVQHISEQVF